MFLEWFRKKGGYDTMEDMYHVAADEVTKVHGTTNASSTELPLLTATSRHFFALKI